jgi:hypothetical protein
MEKSSTVYLLQEPTSDKDLSSAARQGRIVPIMSSNDRPSQNVGATIDKLASHLKYYDPTTDAICFAGGDPIIQFLAGVVLERLGFDEVVFLAWNRERIDGQKTGAGFYMPKRISLVEGDATNFMMEE